MHGVVKVPGVPSVIAAITYVEPTDERPAYYPNPHPPPAGKPRHSAKFDQRNVEVQDIRYAPAHPTFFASGCELVDHRSDVRSFYDKAELAAIYDAEIAHLMRSRFGAKAVYVFDHSWRTRTTQGVQVDSARSFRRGAGSYKRPFPRAHADFTERTAGEMLDKHTPIGLAGLNGRPFSIVNIWRPIVGPLRDQPLAVCDASSVAAEDLIVCDIIYPDRISELLDVGHNPAHKWYFASDMSRDEAWIFSTYMSRPIGACASVPHSAIELPPSEASVLPRESIESRVIAIF